MKKNNYKTPETKVVYLKMSHTLLTISGDTYNQSTSNATEQTGGSFGSRRGGGFWEDDEE